MARDEVVRVLGELVLRERSRDLVDGARAHEEQDGATDDFEGAVESFDRDRELERVVKSSETAALSVG